MNIDDLVVYKIAYDLEVDIFNYFEGLKSEWRLFQIDQILRSSSSVSANIAEGWGKRYYPKEFIKFLVIALGSSDETKHHLKVLYNKKRINETDYNKLFSRYKNLSVRIINLINSIKSNNNL